MLNHVFVFAFSALTWPVGKENAAAGLLVRRLLQLLF